MRKSIDIKNVRKIIMDNREQGISDEETYSILREQYYDKQALAKLIKTTTTRQKIVRYKKWNILLMALCVVIGILYLVEWHLDIYGFNTFAGFIILFDIFFIEGLFKYDINAYRGTIGIASLFSLLSAINMVFPNLFSALSYFQLIILVFNTILSLITIILAIYLKRKLFIPRKERKLMRLE